MKSKFNEKIRLVLTICICVLFIAIGFTSAIGQSLPEKKVLEDRQVNNITQTKSIQPLAFPKFFYKIFNYDWNYWSNPPDVYSIPSGNVGIGTTNPTEKLEVLGTIKMTGFNMPTGANPGYVLTADSTGIGSWQYFSASDGNSLDAADGDPQNVVYVDNDGTVLINTLGTYLTKFGADNKHTDPPNVNIESEGSMTTSVGTNSQTSVGSDMSVNVGNNLDVTVGGNTNINTGKSLTITSGAGTTIVGSTVIDGKLTATGGVDPPYISFSIETHESIREYAKYVEDHEEVMQFWNGDSHRMEIYVISEDVFYTISGEIIEE